MMSDSFTDDQLPTYTVPDLSDQIECTTELVGRGGCGSVYKGIWLGAAANSMPTIIAIKSIDLVPLKDEAKQKRRFKLIRRELSLWCSIKHKNILPLLGTVLMDGNTNIPAFVCPWMENGNAKEFCSRNPRFPPMLILYDIIIGLHYLHTLKPEIVHGDIKAVNVLINNRCEACLCDFGLSRFLIDNTLWKTTATHAGGTVRWMAPELLDGDSSTPTKESDIYAYAMTCYEILSGEVPFKSISKEMALLLKVTKGERPNRMESFHSNFMWDIITRCWEQEPKDRLPTEIVLGLLRVKVDQKEIEGSLANTGEKDVALAKAEKEISVLKDRMAVADEDMKTLKKENEMALAKADEELKVLREERDAALAKADEEMRDLRVAKDRAEMNVNRLYGEVYQLRQDSRKPDTITVQSPMMADMQQQLPTMTNDPQSSTGHFRVIPANLIDDGASSISPQSPASIASPSHLIMLSSSSSFNVASYGATGPSTGVRPSKRAAPFMARLFKKVLRKTNLTWVKNVIRKPAHDGLSIDSMGPMSPINLMPTPPMYPATTIPANIIHDEAFTISEAFSEVMRKPDFTGLLADNDKPEVKEDAITQELAEE